MRSEIFGNKKVELAVLSVCHLLVDGISAAVVFGQGGADIILAAIVYNTCAFTTQCITGILTDKVRRGRLLVLISGLIIAVGALMPLPFMCRAVIVGLGNSLFHVSGGYITLRMSNSIGPLGVFVAPGAVGLFIGTTCPEVCVPFVLALLGLGAVLAFSGDADEIAATGAAENMTSAESVHSETGAAEGMTSAAESAESMTSSVESAESMTTGERVALAAFLLVAIMARAVGGSALSFPWKEGLAAGILMTAAVFAGKTAGGFIADKAGIKTIMVFSAAAAAILLVLCSEWMIPSLAGQFALNVSMPITLYLIYKLFPDSPGFAFGLAASALWPGTLIGKLIHLTGVWADMLIILCLAAGFAAVYITERRLKS